MECGCAVNIDIDGFSDTLANKKQVAKKAHKCSECNRDILPGETYEYYKGVCEGDIFTNKTCVDCLSIRDVFFHDGYYFGKILEDFWIFIDESQGQVAEECLSALSPKAQESVCFAIEEIWEEHWLTYPTQPAVRFGKIYDSLKPWERPGWMHYRTKEIGKMDNAVCR